MGCIQWQCNKNLAQNHTWLAHKVNYLEWTHSTGLIPEAAEQTYVRGGGGAGGGGGVPGVRGCEAADYPRETYACEGHELGGLKPP